MKRLKINMNMNKEAARSAKDRVSEILGDMYTF